ncbi:pentapeptide repeat-containing protein [Streptomyces sp. DSM 40484]|uniref:pentapeptide repeat-containing protein n=1 Tax=Streptomyces kroppenstedtii TaxID=3051181 RepID=UPI0028D3DC3A|nr:pentapeptide repeat-containing protein [Streptomyces sp. DSM 40484]
MSTPSPPSWPYCADGADPASDPVGCRGIHVPGHTVCLAHLADADREAYLADLTPGADIDHRSTTFTDVLLNALLAALCDPATGHARFGHAQFASATFQGDAEFGSVTFEGDAWFALGTFEGGAQFEAATFEGDAWFGLVAFQGGAQFKSSTFQGDAQFGSAIFEGGAWFKAAIFQGGAQFEAATIQGDAGFGSVTFEGDAQFGSVTFEGSTWFKSSTFQGDAQFGSAIFEGGAWFEAVTFEGGTRFNSSTFQDDAQFGSATFQGDAQFKAAIFEDGAWFKAVTFQDGARFEEATFQGDARFEEAVFERRVSLGPLVCAGQVGLSGAVFNGPTTLSFAARRLECRRTRWLSTAEVRLRYASVDLAHAVFEYPVTIAAEAAPFMLSDGREMAEHILSGTSDAGVWMISLRGVDAAHLVLANVDLAVCVFTGTVHLDQVRLEGACFFDTTPHGMHWRRGRPTWFTERRTLAEERDWRARQPAAVPKWRARAPVLATGGAGPAQLAPVYRALRKSFEDSKNEPGAADFYYGEMEMRRHDRTTTSGAERGLLHAYWLLSGYGLRALRALGWLAAAMLVTLVLLMAFGLPTEDPKQEATGTVPPGGGTVTFEIDKDDPQNPTGNRFTGRRFEKALNITLNSVVFRSSGQDLTTAGTYIEMTSRLVEPALLALAVLAVRGRIKR